MARHVGRPMKRQRGKRAETTVIYCVDAHDRNVTFDARYTHTRNNTPYITVVRRGKLAFAASIPAHLSTKRSTREPMWCVNVGQQLWDITNIVPKKTTKDHLSHDKASSKVH